MGGTETGDSETDVGNDTAEDDSLTPLGHRDDVARLRSMLFPPW